MIAGSQAACNKAMVCLGPYQDMAIFLYCFEIGDFI